MVSPLVVRLRIHTRASYDTEWVIPNIYVYIYVYAYVLMNDAYGWCLMAIEWWMMFTNDAWWLLNDEWCLWMMLDSYWMMNDVYEWCLMAIANEWCLWMIAYVNEWYATIVLYAIWMTWTWHMEKYESMEPNECALHMANKGFQLFTLDINIYGHGHGYGVCIVLRGNAI